MSYDRGIEKEIIDFIPYGKANAVSRYELIHFTGWNDRRVRKEISKAREEHIILSSENGSGYYRPTADDYPELRKFIKREESRAKSVFASLKKARALCEDYERGRLDGT